MSSFTKCPPLEAIPPEYKLYRTTVAFEYRVGSKESGKAIPIPKGFITDGVSIPKFAWSIIGGPVGKYTPAAVVHDWCYKFKLYSRLRCDQIFKEALEVLGVGWFKRGTMYNFVRWFGWIGWNKHRRREDEINENRYDDWN